MIAPAGAARANPSRHEPDPVANSGAEVKRPDGIVAVVDARALRSSGIGRYLREVLAHLLQDARFHQVRLLGDPQALNEFCETTDVAGTALVIPYPCGFYSPLAQLAWLTRGRRAVEGADVSFFPHYDAPYLAVSARSVLTVHDLTHFRVPECFPFWRRVLAEVLLRGNVRRAGRIVAVSDSTARDLAARIQGSAAKIHVVPQGVSDLFRVGKKPALEATSARGETPPYLLYVGNRKPHKNLEAAVEVLFRVRRQVPEMRLVLVGAVYRGWERVLQRATELGVLGAIVDRGHVPDVELSTLYRECSALLFLSRYEGFGLPLLEAMACETPVIASNRAAIPEVVGDAGILVGPDDHDGAAAAVLRLLEDPSLAAELGRRGRERAQRYSWDATGRRTADLLVEVAGSHQRSRGIGQ